MRVSISLQSVITSRAATAFLENRRDVGALLLHGRARNFFSTLVPGSGNFQFSVLAGLGYGSGLGFWVVITIFVSLTITLTLITTLTVILP